jgi:hypothetical protein
VKIPLFIQEEVMYKSLIVMLSLLCFCLVGLALAPKDADEKSWVGAWAGTWTGGSSGSFEMTISKGADGKLGGSITPKPEGGESYTASFKSVALADGKVTMKLANPSDEVEITLEATIDGSALKGTYSVRAKADGNEVDRGTITASKKQ